MDDTLGVVAFGLTVAVLTRVVRGRQAEAHGARLAAAGPAPSHLSRDRSFLSGAMPERALICTSCGYCPADSRVEKCPCCGSDSARLLTFA